MPRDPRPMQERRIARAKATQDNARVHLETAKAALARELLAAHRMGIPKVRLAVLAGTSTARVRDRLKEAMSEEARVKGAVR